MTPQTGRAVGAAGVLAGLGLAAEGALFMRSGWTPETFGDAATAVAFLQDSGDDLRVAAFAGAVNLAFASLLVIGLADRLRAVAPVRAAATWCFGVIGIAAHSLVPLGLWLGIPTLVDLAAEDTRAAELAWGGYVVAQDAAGAVGALFLGLSALAAGWAIASTRAMSLLLGWVGIVMGAATATTVLAFGTPVAAAAYFPALVLAIVFRIWAGVDLWLGERQPTPRSSTAAASA